MYIPDMNVHGIYFIPVRNKWISPGQNNPKLAFLIDLFLDKKMEYTNLQVILP
jgi:hypothetical protein